MSKRDGESVDGSETAKKQKMGDDATTVAVDFEEATKYRTFKFIVEDKSIFVSPHFLAEISPFFEALCFGSFAEGQKGEAELKDVKYADAIEMLHVLGADRDNDRKEIEVDNCARMLGVADRWQIDVLRKRCVVFIETKFPTIRTNFRKTLGLLIACEELRVHGKALQNVASRLAWFGEDVLLEQNVCSYIADTALGAAIFSAAKGLRRDVGTTITKHSPVGDFLPDSACQSSECSFAMAKKCENCKKFLCEKHLSFVCTTRLATIVISCGNVHLDARFFADSE